MSIFVETELLNAEVLINTLALLLFNCLSNHIVPPIIQPMVAMPKNDGSIFLVSTLNFMLFVFYDDKIREYGCNFQENGNINF